MTYLTHQHLFSCFLCLCPEGATPSKPRVAASATLGKKTIPNLRNRNAVALSVDRLTKRRNRFAVAFSSAVPRVAEAATLGFEALPLRGKSDTAIIKSLLMSQVYDYRF
jgi:hypothetical protein